MSSFKHNMLQNAHIIIDQDRTANKTKTITKLRERKICGADWWVFFNWVRTCWGFTIDRHAENQPFRGLNFALMDPWRFLFHVSLKWAFLKSSFENWEIISNFSQKNVFRGPVILWVEVSCKWWGCKIHIMKINTD